MEEQHAVERVLRRLIQDEGIPSAAVTLLTARAENKSLWKEGTRIAGCVLSWNPKSGAGGGACSTIHSFKGLENSVIVITETAHIPEKARRELLYVVYSRAKFHLIVCERLQEPASR